MYWIHCIQQQCISPYLEAGEGQGQCVGIQCLTRVHFLARKCTISLCPQVEEAARELKEAGSFMYSPCSWGMPSIPLLTQVLPSLWVGSLTFQFQGWKHTVWSQRHVCGIHRPRQSLRDTVSVPETSLLGGREGRTDGEQRLPELVSPRPWLRPRVAEHFWKCGRGVNQKTRTCGRPPPLVAKPHRKWPWAGSGGP